MPHERSMRRRELFLVLLLGVAFIAFLVVYFLMIGGGLFVALLMVSAAIAVVGCLHYLIWGRSNKNSQRPT